MSRAMASGLLRALLLTGCARLHPQTDAQIVQDCLRQAYLECQVTRTGKGYVCDQAYLQARQFLTQGGF